MMAYSYTYAYRYRYMCRVYVWVLHVLQISKRMPLTCIYSREYQRRTVIKI